MAKKKMGKFFSKETFLSTWAYIGYTWIVASVLQLVAVIIPEWGKATLPGGVKYTEGLWTHCIDGNCTFKNPLSREDAGNPGFQVQSLELPGLVLIFVSTLHWWMALTRELRSQIQDWIFTGLAILGDILILAGIAIYARKNVFLGGEREGLEQITFHSSFIIACIVLIMSVFATVGGTYLIAQYHIIRRPPWKYRP